MPWLKSRDTDSGTSYHICDRVDKKIRMIAVVGTWKQGATTALENYKKAKLLGYVYMGHPVPMADIVAFMEAKQKGVTLTAEVKRLPIDEMCDFFLKQHGPSLKGGYGEHSRSNYYNLKIRLGLIKDAWAGKFADEINLYSVRDFLAPCKTVGTRLKYLGTVGKLFKEYKEWNDDRTVLPVPVSLPANNPAKAWRAKMAPAHKKERPLARVMSREEWQRLAPCLTKRGRAICEIALQRFLRLADIKQISSRQITGDFIVGLQEKTGEPFRIPTMADHTHRYDFRNFKKEFAAALVQANLEFPPDHPLHLTPRDLRRTGATWAYRAGKDLVAISRMLGHAKITTTIRYLNIDDADLASVARIMDDLAAIPGSTGVAKVNK